MKSEYLPQKQIKCFIRQKISVSLDECLSSNDLFRQFPKTIAATLNFFNILHGRQRTNKMRPVTFYSRTIKRIYESACLEVSYTQFILALISLGLLERNNQYFTKKEHGEGKCYEYNLTPLAITLLLDINTKYFHHIHNDMEGVRKSKERRKKNCLRSKPVSDPFLENQRTTLLGVTVDYDKAVAIHQKVQCAEAIQILTDLKEGRIGSQKRNDADNRSYNPVVGMKSEYRPCLSVEDMPYVATIDMRACHLTFLAELLLQKSCGGEVITAEADKWNRMVTAEKDFRKSLGKNAKEQLNAWINGKKSKRLDRWFSTEYPNLFKVLRALAYQQRKHVGCEISKKYETKLFQEPAIFAYAKSLGLHLVCEYDGYGVFGMGDVTERLAQLAEHIRNRALQLFGFKPVFKIENKMEVSLYENENKKQSSVSPNGLGFMPVQGNETSTTLRPQVHPVRPVGRTSPTDCLYSHNGTPGQNRTGISCLEKPRGFRQASNDLQIISNN